MVKDYFELEMDIELQDKLVEAYKKVEEAGIKVDLSCLNNKYQFQHKEYSLLGDTIYSYYNLYNLTGRPTNSFNGVNFLAIPKDKDFRECFVPKNDFLVEFDFDAYHLRLISSMIGFEPPKESMHNYLGRAYFHVDELTPEQYKESKAITFKQLYGGIERQYEDIDFFRSLNQFIDQEWKKYNAHKALVLPTGRILKRLPGMNRLKLFNYIVQNLETKENIYKIIEINKLLSKKKTKLILITYDSFLFDFSQQDGKDLLKQIKHILEGNNMIVKHKYGVNYAF
jgi:DNA polymerase I-like protein with 3'-5' exonuclease and polymerase domains